jgi:L-2-amino-thiazoline-4-carboxylic acid hydrolase
VRKKPELLKNFEAEAKVWSPLVLKQYGEIQCFKILRQARVNFEKLIPQIPYIGGEENNFTKNLVESVQYLALYQAMKAHGKTAEEAGKVIYDAYLIKSRVPKSPVPPAKRLTPEQLMERRKKGAEKSQERRYPGDYVYTFVVGDGREFDYGYDLTECASQKFYRQQGAEAFLPYYCYLDFVAGKAQGFGFSRTMNLYEGHGKCNHRFKAGGRTEAKWPPPFLKEKRRS